MKTAFPSNGRVESRYPSGDLSLTKVTLSFLLLLIATAAVYFPIAQFGFLDYDDDTYILRDPAVQQLNWESLKTIFLEPYSKVWYPVARLSAAIDISLFGHDARGHHLVSALIHALNALLLFVVLVLFGRRILPADENSKLTLYLALLVSLAFVVHPQHVETVTWLVQRKELLATFFSLLAIVLHLKARLWWATVFLVIAMLSKPTAIAIPFLLVLLEILLLNPAARNLAKVLGVLRANSVSMLVAFGIAMLVMANSEDSMWLTEYFDWPSRVVLYADNALHGISGFVTLRAGVFHLPIPDYVLELSPLGILSLIVLAVLVMVSVLLMLNKRLSARFIGFGLIFYCVALLPTGGLILFGNYAFGDRYLYLSTVGLYLAAYVLLAELLKSFDKRRVRLVFFGFVIWICAGFGLSHTALPRWQSTEALWFDNVQRYPESVKANHELGFYYFMQGDYEPAFKYLYASIASPAEHYRVFPRVSSALYIAEMMCVMGRDKAAVEILDVIPEVNGAVSAVDGLMSSLKSMGYNSCYEQVRVWRGSHPGS